MIATAHFCDRVRERIGPDTDPHVIAQILDREIERGRSAFVAYLGREHRGRARKWRITLPDGRAFVAVVDTSRQRMRGITIYDEPEGTA